MQATSFLPGLLTRDTKALSVRIEPARPKRTLAPVAALISANAPDLAQDHMPEPWREVSRDDTHLLVSTFDESMKAHERLRILVRVLDFDGVSLEALRHERLWWVKMGGLKQVDRYALVSGPDWMETVAKWSAPRTRIETRRFSPDEEQRAWDRLEAEPAVPAGT